MLSAKCGFDIGLIFPQSGLHAEVCEIDHKLHAVVAGRRRAVIQSIQEDTCTNIYFPSPLQGLVGPDGTANNAVAANNGSSSRSNSNAIWITGEFFGVQRARDMLFKLSVHHVRNRCACSCKHNADSFAFLRARV